MHTFSYANQDLVFKQCAIDDSTPIGSQILRSIGLTPKDNLLIYQQLDQKGMEEISLEEKIDFKKGNKFFIVEGDRSFKFKIDGYSYEWSQAVITLKHLQVFTGGLEKAFVLTRKNQNDLLIDENQLIHLDQNGIEDIYTQEVRQTFELNVNGKLITLKTSQIVVSEALSIAGIDDSHNYQMFLKIQGEPKKEVFLNSVIDLSKPGIEKLRLIPKGINNGDPSSYQFDLLAKDFDYLKNVFPQHRTIIEQNRRWLIVDNYSLPEGYNCKTVSIAIEVPSTYPQAEIDMFYTYPRVYLTNGSMPACTEVTQAIEGNQYQRWSRHRSISPWQPLIDNVATHFALVEESIIREVQ